MNDPPVEVDPEIKKLTAGTEALLFPGETLAVSSHDSFPNSSPVERVPTPFPSELTPTSFVPGTRITDANNKVYIIDSAGQAVAVLAEQVPPESPHKKPKKFFHSPIPNKRYSRPETLLRSHSEFLEAVNYDSIMDSSTSGRFGKWDTTSTLHNSANNSRGSKASSGLSAKSKR